MLRKCQLCTDLLRKTRYTQRAVQACGRLGATGWNAFSINLDYRTGSHTDGKNAAGSLSALLILETGTPFEGGLYLLPQYHVGIHVRQGIALLHRCAPFFPMVR